MSDHDEDERLRAFYARQAEREAEYQARAAAKKAEREAARAQRRAERRALGVPLPGDWRTVSQVALLLGREERTVRRWCATGKIPASQVAPGGDWRIDGAWVDEELARVRVH